MIPDIEENRRICEVVRVKCLFKRAFSPPLYIIFDFIPHQESILIRSRYDVGFDLNAISSKAQHKVVITEALILAKKVEVGTALGDNCFNGSVRECFYRRRDLILNKKKSWVMY
ncbi:MAG: hypothetical protein KI793_31750 [Rivularia sp. (in: Bacteria)]|nr:hypothetical protein [Rivularia sp. MS3]